MGNAEHDTTGIPATVAGLTDDAGRIGENIGNKITMAMKEKIISSGQLAIGNRQWAISKEPCAGSCQLPIRYFLLLIAYCLLLISPGCNSSDKNNSKTASKQLYRCPMHHEIVRDKPGNCPVCGM